MRQRLLDRINGAMEGVIPEKRLFLKSDAGMRFVRLRPLTQAMIVGASGLLLTWTAILSAVFFIDLVNAGSSRDQAQRASAAYQARLNAMSAERDARAIEAQAAHERFGVAMDQVSQMQSRLLASEERRRELETAVNVIQAGLRRTIAERDAARIEAARLLADIESETGEAHQAARSLRDLDQTVGFLTQALAQTAQSRDAAQTAYAEARARVQDMEFASALANERNARIFSQIEDAVAMSMEPLNEMFNSAGLPTETILETVRRGYQGQGGPLMPLALSTSGGEPDPTTIRANEVLADLDILNLYRVAAESLPFSQPVTRNVRFTSGFGYRSDPINGGRRLHAGVDFAGPVGTPLYATADGVVVKAERQGAYGLLVEIRHTMGYTTRYAHMSRISVSRGERVSRGDRIGDMGRTGRVTGPHIHYEVRQNGTPINPMTFITAGRHVF